MFAASAVSGVSISSSTILALRRATGQFQVNRRTPAIVPARRAGVSSDSSSLSSKTRKANRSLVPRRTETKAIERATLTSVTTASGTDVVPRTVVTHSDRSANKAHAEARIRPSIPPSHLQHPTVPRQVPMHLHLPTAERRRHPVADEAGLAAAELEQADNGSHRRHEGGRCTHRGCQARCRTST